MGVLKRCLQNKKNGQSLVECIVVLPILLALLSFGYMALTLTLKRLEQEGRIRQKVMNLKTKRKYQNYRRYQERDIERILLLLRPPKDSKGVRSDDAIDIDETVHFGDS